MIELIGYSIIFVLFVICLIYLSKKKTKERKIEKKQVYEKWEKEGLQELEREGYPIPMEYQEKYKNFEEIIKKHKNDLEFI